MANMVSNKMLNDAKIKAAKPRDKDYRLTDSGQLYLQVSRAGGKHWRMNYTFGTNAKGKPAQKTLAFGSYPSITLVTARGLRDDAKAVLARGLDPAVERKNEKRAQVEAVVNTFETVTRQWHAKQKPRWSKIHAADVIKSLEENIFPKLGDRPIGDIKAPDVLQLLVAIEQRGAIETAHRIRTRCSAVFVFAIASGLCEHDPAGSLGKALAPKPRSKKQPAIVDGHDTIDQRISAIRQVLIDAEAERCRAITKFALRLLALTATRPGEIRFAAWSEFLGIDWDRGTAKEPLWRIPAARMKGDEDRKAEAEGDHLVPLSAQAVELLLELRPLSGDLDLLFPGERHLHRPISENTLRALLIRAGYYQRHVPHGFRAAFSTIMNERAKLLKNPDDRAVIDLMLAHVPQGTSGSEGSYNRASYMPRRRELAQEWADILVGDMWPPAIHLGQPIRYAATGTGRYM
ncbi:tyrosine-type recombinase/integrase [Sphingomonas sp. VDB2]|uniref:tyrosine-type recombinase/integrase n=1 Tax=Sphingomonas sp. VDB2 TaxID=3228751 RepID=UPI003A7FE76C